MGRRKGLDKYSTHSMVTHSQEDLTNTELLPKKQGVHTPHQASQPLGPVPKRWGPRTSGFENQWGFPPGDPKGWRELKAPHLNGSRANLFTSGPSAKVATWKVSRLHEKEIHLLIINHLPVGQRPVGRSLVVVMLPPPGHGAAADWKVPTVFSWKRPIYWSCLLLFTSAWGAGFRFTARLGTPAMLSGDRGHLCALPWPPCISPISSRKKYIHSSGAPNFATLPWGHLKINLSGGQEGLPQDLHSHKTVCISLKKFFDMCTQLYLLTHSNILAWRIPWTEHPGRLQCIGWQSVGHDWSDLARVFAPRHVESSWTGEQISIGRWIPIHCANREVHVAFVLVFAVHEVNQLYVYLCPLLEYLSHPSPIYHEVE